MRSSSKKGLFLAVVLGTIITVCGCVDQTGGKTSTNSEEYEMPEKEIEAQDIRIAATSVAVMQICEKLDLDLVGVPKSDIVEIPERYANAELVGSPMSPDLEILTKLKPDLVLSPSSLMSDLQPKYDAAGFTYAFLNLKSVEGMFQSITDLGELTNRESQAKEIVNEYSKFMESYQNNHADQKQPTVLILMGLPGSYVVATPNSYVGSLVKMAGGQNVYAENEDEFLNVNTEDMLEKQPDLILRTAHAMPESVMEMFAEEFQTNDIWKHFTAVQNNQVYDLSNEEFGMSANFHYQEALEVLDQILYADDLVLGGENESE